MGKKKRKTKTIAEKARRDNELKLYGKLLSLRPSIEHKAKNLYTRKIKHKSHEIPTED